MMEVVKMLAFRLARLIIRVFFIFPLNNNKVFFESYSGKGYSCNPKCISEFLYNNYGGEYEIVWGLCNPSEVKDSYFKKAKKTSIKYFYHRLTSKYIVTNVADAVYIPKRKGQLLINTWHAGGAYKKVGKSYKLSEEKLVEWQSRIIRDSTDIFVSSSQRFTETNIHDGYGYYKTILNVGMPRNDLFFYDNRIQEAASHIDTLFNVRDLFVVLYAPTFRNGNRKIQDTFSISKLTFKVEELTGKKCVIMLRSHHYENQKLQNGNNRNVIDVTWYPDMQELLARANMLITDYSSCMWDFCLLERPCFLFMPDFESYDKERGFFTSPETWPGFFAKTSEELIDQITQDNLKKASSLARDHLVSFGSFENGHATESVCTYIWGRMNDEQF